MIIIEVNCSKEELIQLIGNYGRCSYRLGEADIKDSGYIIGRKVLDADDAKRKLLKILKLS